MLKEKDKAPNFTLKDTYENDVTLSDFIGKKVVIYFYPKDSTPGCTKQACNFRDNIEKFEENNIAVIGISADDAKSHKKFTEKYKLPFTLLSDTEKEVVKLYGVWREKMNFGVAAFGIVRTTFIIDEKGYIEKIFDKVKASINAEEVMEYLGDTNV
ncbi:MAG: thioredoxin-dependent thiol peroxidase [Defluviitaleaceae bacterium]|nr:thioredoxin-dependent thiol peroxidase [Defluviitaleaceae bacterium]